jgi:hypothetical protein
MIFLQKQAHVHSQHNKGRAHTHTPHHFIYLFLHRLQILLPAKQAVQARGLIMSLLFPSLLFSRRPPFFSSKASQTVAASAAVAFPKPQPSPHLPCPLCPSSLHLPVLQGCQDCKGANGTAPARYIAPVLEQSMCSLSALGRVVNSGEGVKGGGWPIQETVAKEVTVKVRGYLLGAFAPMTLMPIVVGREARSERVASSTQKRERK